mmetsp:Transcript_155569/g.282965  ORF Transcript_155569/g.282965 Transcript_155569/m.282965 type:complete len:91 (-) Transcript_155569:787-1059(-)
MAIRHCLGASSLIMTVVHGSPTPHANPMATRQASSDLPSGATDVPQAHMAMKAYDASIGGLRPKRSPSQPPSMEPGIKPTAIAEERRARP